VYFKDFEYDNQRLSDFGCVICHILEGGDASAISIGSQLTFNTLPIVGVNKFKLMSTQYDEAYTATFEVCKFNCDDLNDNFFTQEEITHFMRWLNKKTFKKFKVIYENGELAKVYYNASFNVSPISYFGNVIGLQLTLQTDAPFAYYDEVEYTMEFSGDNLQHTYYDISDEIGYIYPSSMTIEILNSGDFELTNSQEPNRVTSIENCRANEVITLVENKVISSTNSHLQLYNDFNYVFPRICNENEDIYDIGTPVDNMANTFTVNMPCKITFKYSPVCKMGIV
jgi:hypothetical protein